MTTLAVTFYDVVLWVHITAVVIAFGPTFAFGIYMAVTAAKHPRSMPAALDAQNVVNMTMVTGGAILALLSGLYLAIDGDWFEEVFVAVGIVAVLALLGLTHGFFLPNDRATLAAAQRDIDAARDGGVEFGEEVNRRAAASTRVGTIAGLIIVLTIYFMTAKPFL